MVSPSSNALGSCTSLVVLEARQMAQFSCDRPPKHQFGAPEVRNWAPPRCSIPPQIGIAWPTCIMVSPSSNALGSCTSLVVLEARQMAQFSCDRPPKHQIGVPEVRNWAPPRCSIPPQIGITWPTCIMVSPSSNALGSCTW